MRLLKRIWVDFNAQNDDGSVRLTTRGSTESMKLAGGVQMGEKILITDGDETFQAEVQLKNGELVARADFTT